MSSKVLSALLPTFVAVTGLIVSQSTMANEIDTNQPVSVDTMVVNARYWDESADKVPESLVVIDGDELDQQGLDLIETEVPNVRIERSSVQTRIVTRGLSGIDTGLQDPLAYYFNGVALPLGGNQLPLFIDINQLEFLKGPQGSLYGRNSESGLLKIESNDPTWEPSIAADVGSSVIDGADGHTLGQVISLRASNALIGDSIAGAFALRLEDTEGPNYNLANDSNEGGESKNWTLSTGLTFDSQQNTLIDIRSLIEHKDAGKGRIRFKDGNFATERFTTNYNSDTFDDSESSIHSIKVEHAFKGFDLTATTGYTDYEREFQADLDSFTFPLPETLMNLEDSMISQELRLSSSSENDLRWVAGVYVFDQGTDINFRIGGPPTTRVTNIDHKGLAVFGQLEYALNNNFALTLGSRLEESRQSGQQSVASIAGGSAYEKDLNTSQHLPKATLRYTINDDSLAYLSVAKGYLPGGYNYSFSNTVDNFTYEPEISENIELGYKVNNDKFSINTAMFYIKTEDKQIVDIEPGNVQRISNAAETQSYGVELAVDYQFTPSFSAYSNLGIQRARANEYTRNLFIGGGFTEVNLDGNVLPNAPRETYSVGVKYKSVNDVGVFGSLGINGANSYYLDSLNQIEQPSYQKVDAEIGYQFRYARLALAATNLTDEEIYSRALILPAGTLVEDTAPRTYTFNISAEW